MCKIIRKIVNKVIGGNKMRAIKVGDNLSGITLKIKDGLTFQELKETLGNSSSDKAINISNGEQKSIIGFEAIFNDYADIVNYKIVIGEPKECGYSEATLFDDDGNLIIHKIYVSLSINFKIEYFMGSTHSIDTNNIWSDVLTFEPNHSHSNVICDNLCLDDGITKNQLIEELKIIDKNLNNK